MSFYDPEDFGIDPDEELDQSPDLDSPYRLNIDDEGPLGGVLSQLDQSPLQPDQRATIQKRLDEISEGRKGAIKQMDEIEAGRSRTADEKKAIIKEAKSRLLKQRPDNTELLLSLSGALLSPTRTGAFTESLGNAASAAAPQLARMREFETNLAGKVGDLDLKSLAIDEQATGNRLNALFKRLGIEDSEQRYLLAQMNRKGPTAPRPFTYMRDNKKITEFYNPDGSVAREEEGDAWAPPRPNNTKEMSPAQEAALDLQIERLVESQIAKRKFRNPEEMEAYRQQELARLNALYRRGQTLPESAGGEKVLPRTSNPGQDTVDREWAKDNADFMTKDFAEIEKNINGIQGVINILTDSEKNSTGWGSFAVLPPTVRRMIPSGAAERSVDLQNRVEQVVQQNLRQVLGGQFAQLEGAQLIKRAYDPQATEEENIERLTALQESIMAAAKAKKAQAEYFNENGTLAGYKGAMNVWVEPDFDKIGERYGGNRKNPRTQDAESNRGDLAAKEARRQELLNKARQP